MEIFFLRLKYNVYFKYIIINIFMYVRGFFWGGWGGGGEVR